MIASLRSIVAALLVVLGVVRAVDRVYYIAANEVLWDYAPLGVDPNSIGNMSSMAMNDTMGMGSGWDSYAVSAPNRIGRVYKKVIYQEFTDASFRTLKARPAEQQFLGFLGPVLRVLVGDSMRILFYNNATRPYSMHPHGVVYNKENAGVPYVDEMGMPRGFVSPGAKFEYQWEVPDRAGPGSRDPSSILWLYHSHVDEIADVHAGLVGGILVSRPSKVSAGSLMPLDLTSEYPLVFWIVDETASHYFDENMRRFLPTLNDTERAELAMDEDFMHSNLKHSVNGFLFSNVPGLSVQVNDTVRWHAVGLGGERDVHGIHWHGQVLDWGGRRMDVTDLIPATVRTLDMIPDNPGTWLIHCHTDHHTFAGMSALFTVRSCSGYCPVKSGLVSSAPASTHDLVQKGLLFFASAFVLLSSW